MAKDRFSRERTHDTNIKTVIIRLDYSGVADLFDLVKLFDKKFPSEFRERSEHHNREYNLKLQKEDIETISKTLSLPVSVIQCETIMRYHGMRHGNCDVFMDISKYYLCMTLNCESNYDGIDNYLSSFKGAITLFKEKIPYFRPRRLGLRKVRVESKPSLDDFKNIFEDQLFRNHIFGYDAPALLRKESIDCFEVTQFDNLRFNVRGLMNQGKSPEGNFLYTSTLDIDAYYTDKSLSNIDINRLISTANLQEFEVYKSCMKESYLESIYR